MNLLEEAFWVTNISNMNVSLLDLGLTVPAFSSINLLDSRHHKFTPAQLKKSAEAGSIFKKSNRIKVRVVAPKGSVPGLIFREDDYMPSRTKSIVPVIVPHYEELNLSDESFANENYDLAELDRQPILPKTK